jgi:hypothetical protein
LTASAKALACASLLMSACEDPIDCPDCGDDTEAPLAPALELSDSELDFGEIPLAETTRMSLGIGNPGGSDLVLSDIGASDPFVARYDDSITVAANNSAMLYVEITPTAADSYSGTLAFTWNDPDAGAEGTTVQLTLSASVLEDTGLDD